MSRSLTVPVPSSRRLLTWLAVGLGTVALLLIGVRVGAMLFAPSPLMSVASGGELHQVQVLSGTVYLGRLTSDDGGVLLLGAPAVLRQDSATVQSGEQSGARLVVQSLSADPFDIASDIAIPKDSVTMVGVVSSGSALAQAYGQAIGTVPTPSTSPAP